MKQTITQQGRDRKVMSDLYAQMYLRQPEVEQLEPLVDAVGFMAPEVHRSYFYQEYPSVVISDRLVEIEPPVLHLLGRQDSVVDPAEQHLTAAGLRRGKEIVFAEEGHMLPLESPERAAREISAFCRHDL
ncbi:MAG: alpha/beta hydrolase [Pseudomonadales bacterium]